MQPLIVKIEGGLGNQLLQYLFGQSLSRLHNKDVFFDISEYTEGRGIRRFALTELGLPGKFISCKKNISNDNQFVHLRKIKSHGKSLQLFDWFRLRQKIPLIYERAAATLLDFTSTPSAYFLGYWVSFNYWHHPRELVAWVNGYLDRTAAARAKSSSARLPNATNACAIHVRRGDYLNPEHFAWHGVCSVEYFNQSIAASQSADHVFFSDDMSFIDSAFSNNPHYANASRLIGNEIDEFLLLRNYRKMVISNSTYSYLAALFASFRFTEALIMTPYPWYRWGSGQPPLLPTWQRFNAVTGIHEAKDLAAASQLKLNVLLYDFSDTVELTHSLKMLRGQTRRPTHITVQLKPFVTDALAIRDFTREAFGTEPIFIQATNQNSFLCQALDRTQTDFIIFLDPDTRWQDEKLASDLKLAAEVQADVIVSRISFLEWPNHVHTPLNINTSVQNVSTLTDRTITSLLSGLCTALIRTSAFSQLSQDDLIYELALSKQTFFVQDQILAQYCESTHAFNRLIQKLDDLSKILLRLRTDPRAANALEASVETLFTQLDHLIRNTHHSADT